MLVLLVGCQSLPANRDRSPEYKLTEVQDTQLAQKVRSLPDSRPGMTAFFPLASGSDALNARLELVAAAEKSLDLQYYIWHRDDAGRKLAALLVQAADRGVRVRLLLDDLGAPVGDSTLLALHQHPNIEVRLFNPLTHRSARLWSMLTDFARVNRRMHNKSLTADNSVAIVGGRNIGNEYFTADHEIAFADLDLVVSGPVVNQVSDGFDLYWNHPASYAIDRLTDAVVDEQASRRDRKQLETYVRIPEPVLQWNGGWFWGKARVLYDHPDKAKGSDMSSDKLLVNQLAASVAQASSRLLVVSPYFIPGKQGVQYFTDMEQRGVEVTILTNSLAATDVGLVHSGYAKYRKSLLENGVELYEMRPDPGRRAAPKEDSKDKTAPYVGSSAKASLHAKAFFIDRRYTFVGSMNLDPRSLQINTEIGVYLESPTFTELAHDQILASLEQDAYRLVLEDGDIRWISREGEEERIYDTEPQVSRWQRFSTWFLGLFPIESQL